MPTIKKSCQRPWMSVSKPQEGRVHSNTKFYQSMAWRNLRAVKIREQPLCEECMKREILTPARVVDHIIPINKGGSPLDLNNLQSLCNRCHNIKSGREAHQ